MNVKIIEVRDKNTEREFLETARLLNKKYPQWVSPLDMEIRDIFNPRKNPLFKDGKAKRWIAKNEKGELIGRIAAFYHKEKAYRYKLPTGGAGFFESIDNENVAFALFDTAKNWLEKEGMKAMDAPTNFGENDRYWGLLVKGFEYAPAFGMNYNPPYYEKLFENYGFKTYFEQVSKHLDISKPMPERFQKIWNWIQKKEGLRFEYAKKKNLEKYALDFMKIYNQAWQFHEHFTEMTREKAFRLAEELKPLFIEKFLIFAYVNEEPAGVLVALPDLNQVFKKFQGKFSFLNMLEFLWKKRNDYAYYRKKGILNRLRVLSIGVIPKYQRYGLEVGMTMVNMKDAKEMGFQEVELSWVGDFNPLSRRLQDATGAKLAKIHKTYRYAFNKEDEPFLFEKQIIKR